MGIWLLQLQAELENVEVLTFPEGYSWTLDVKHSTGEEVRSYVSFTSLDSLDIPNSRGKANFMVRFGGSQQYATINVKQIPKVTQPYTLQDTNAYVPIIGFECRGLDPIAWYPVEGCVVKSTGGKMFYDVDLSEDWCDYDENKNFPVGVYKIDYKFVYTK